MKLLNSVFTSAFCASLAVSASVASATDLIIRGQQAKLLYTDLLDRRLHMMALRVICTIKEKVFFAVIRMLISQTMDNQFQQTPRLVMLAR